MSPDTDDRSTARPPVLSNALRNCVVFLAVVAGGVVVMYLRGILAPLVVAAFLLMLIDGLDRTLAQRLPAVPSTSANPARST